MILMCTKILDRVTWKHWLIFLVISQVVYDIMLTYTIPFIQNEAGGLQIFDLLPFGYTYTYAHLFLTQLSVKGYHMYKVVQLQLLDLLFPFFNCAMGICTLVLLKRLHVAIKGNPVQWRYGLIFKIVLFLPVCAMIFDYLENLMILRMLSLKTTISTELVSISSTFTIIKSMSTMLFYIIITIFCIQISVLWMRKKMMRMNTDGKI